MIDPKEAKKSQQVQAPLELKGVRRELLDKSKKFQLDFFDSAEALPQHEIECAKGKRDKANELTYAIGTQIKLAEDALDGLKEMLKENLATDDNKDGLLTQEMEEWLSCFKLDKVKLRQLCDQVNAHWESNLSQTEARTYEVQNELMQLIQSQQDALEQYLTKFQLVKQVSSAKQAAPSYSLKQLGLVGKTKIEVIDFFWPTTVENLPEDVYVAKMTFKNYANVINYVQFTLSDGTSSPVIQTPQGSKSNEKTLSFEANAAQNITSIKNYGTSGEVVDMYFCDANGETTAFYDPDNKFAKTNKVQKQFKLAENERIIGFYGAGIEG